MTYDPWLEELKRMQAAKSQDEEARDEQEWSDDDAPCDEVTTSFFEQIANGDFPVRIPMTMEFIADGPEPQIRALLPGERPSQPSSQVVTVVLEYTRAKVREIMLGWLEKPRVPGRSKLPGLVGLERVDRQCFLQTSAAHFANTLSETDKSLRRDPWLVEFLRELHECDQELIPELVSETIKLDRASGGRLRDLILDCVANSSVREHLGWLVAATITDRVQEL